MSDYTNVLVATEDNLAIYDYLPNEGLKINRSINRITLCIDYLSTKDSK